MLCDKPLRHPSHLDMLQSEWVGHVRGLARKPDRDSVEQAVDAVFAAQKFKAPWLHAMVHECRAATGSGEWDHWDLRQEMGQWVDSLLDALARGRHWTEGERDFEEKWSAFQRFDELRRQRKPRPG